jgi:hypothetical protein
LVFPFDFRQLLSGKYADTRVREFAVEKLDSLSDDELIDYLPQLAQVGGA